MAQLDLFGAPKRPPSNWSRTSRLAAGAIREHAPTIRARIVAWIAARGAHGATNDEIVAGTGILLQTVCARVNESTALGLLRDSGRVRITRTGRYAKVWEVCT